ncbi:hypothetical protein M3J09_005504 [Ascochyta lentis]
MTSFGAKWEPQAASGHDHDHDEHCHCHAEHIHRGSISGGTTLEPAQKLDPILDVEEGSTNYGSHNTNVANKLDPRVGSDGDHRSDDFNAQTPRVDSFVRRGTEPLIHTSHAPSGSDDEFDRHARRASLSQQSHGSTAPSDEPRSTANPHRSDFLNLLDPRVDRNDVKQTRSSGS